VLALRRSAAKMRLNREAAEDRAAVGSATSSPRAISGTRGPRCPLELLLREEPGDLGVRGEVGDRVVGVEVAAHQQQRGGDLVGEVVALGVVAGPGQRAHELAHLGGEPAQLGRVAGEEAARGQGVHGAHGLADRVALPAAVELGGDLGDGVERELGDLAQRADQRQPLDVLRAVAGLVLRVRRSGREQPLAEVELDRGARDPRPLRELGQAHAGRLTWELGHV
jgi:hypothetical protein